MNNQPLKDVSEMLNVTDKNTAFMLFDKDGNPKPLWNENRLGRLFRMLGREIRIPFITGVYGDVMFSHNLITNVGHAGANGRMSNQGSYSPFVNLAIGQGTGAAAATDMALQNEINANGGQRGAATATQVTTTVTNDTTQLVKTFALTATFAITEEGIFDNTTAPTETTTTQSRINTDTTVTVTSGTGIANNDFLQWESEIVQVTAGGGTTTLTLSRGQKGTTAASHASGTTVNDITVNVGNLLARQTFSVINVNSGDSLQITHKYQT